MKIWPIKGFQPKVFVGLFLLLTILISLAFPGIKSASGKIAGNSLNGGINWTVCPGMSLPTMSDVVYGNRMFVAVGFDGTIRTSPDGVKWTNRKSGTLNWLKQVIWNGKLFIAGGENGTILSSKDGILWTTVKSGTSHDITGLAWNGKQFMAVGTKLSVVYSIVLTSSDGARWTSRKIGGINNVCVDFCGLNWINGQYMSTDRSTQSILVSPDGSKWTRVYTNGFGELKGLSYNGKVYVAYGDYIKFSTDLKEWKTLNDVGNIYDVVWDGSQFTAVGGGGLIMTSVDGSNWTRITSPTKEYLFSIAVSGPTKVAVGDGGVIIVSTDEKRRGFHQVSSTNTRLQKIKWLGGRFIAMGNQGTYASKDGRQWTKGEYNDTTGFINFVDAVAFDGKRYLAFAGCSEGQGNSQGQNIYTAIFISADARKWVRSPVRISHWVSDMVWDGHRFIGVSGDGTIVMSSNGLKWTATNFGPVKGQNPITLMRILWNKKNYAVLGVTGGNSITTYFATSIDGNKWTQRKCFQDTEINDIFWTGKQYVAVGYWNHDANQPGRTVIVTSRDGSKWAEGKHPLKSNPYQNAFLCGVGWNGRQYLAVGGDGAMLSSSDAVTWKQISTITKSTLNQVAWSGRDFVVVGDGIVVAGH